MKLLSYISFNLMLLLHTLSVFGQNTGHNYIKCTETIDTDKTLTTIDYYDGLGRHYETVRKNVTDEGGNIVTVTEYDAFGRIIRKWIPLSCTQDHITPSNAHTFATETYGDSRAYEEFSYENSPLNRVTQLKKAGAAWKSHPATIEYKGNTQTHPYTCKDYSMNESGQLSYSGLYATGTLYVTETTDEDGHKTIDFKDFSGRQILSRKLLQDGTAADTYYVYNMKGQLCAVLQPEYQNDSDLSRHSFRYSYDGLGNVISKTLPGIEPITYTYNSNNQQIFSQDGNQRIQGISIFYEYDNLGRLSCSGTCHGMNAQNSRNELIHNYYDRYTFVGNGIFQSGASQPFINTYGNNAVGFITGIEMATLPEGTNTGKMFFYDTKGRECSSLNFNHTGGTDQTSTSYSLADTPTDVQKQHSLSGFTTINDRQTYTYDKAGRVSEISSQVFSEQKHNLCNFTYDKIGRLTESTFHGNPQLKQSYAYNIQGWLTSVSSSAFTQNLYYNGGYGPAYFNGNIGSMTWKNGTDNIIRGYRFFYDYMNRLTQSVYGEGSTITTKNKYDEKVTGYDLNGNILTLKRNGLQDGGTYGLVDNLTYTYNGNQLTKISDSVEDPTYAGAFNFVDGTDSSAEYTYDAVGNMTSDKNKGITSITYNVINQPQKITFSDGSTTEYKYSADGTKLRVTHTTVNMPSEYPLSVVMTQSATGTSTVTTTDYLDNAVYENGRPKMISNCYGFVTFDSKMKAINHYYMHDHQGNNRTVVNENGTVEQINHYYPYGGLMADICTGSDVQPYKYNGKELDRMHGLDTYDYGARQHNAATGRWDRMDQLAEENPEVSPNVYCHNNPINKIDPDGMDDYYSITGQYLSHEDNGTDFIIIRDQFIHELKQAYGMEWLKSDTPISEMTLTAKAYSNIFTDILSKMDGVDVNDLYNGKVSVTVWEDYDNLKATTDQYNDAGLNGSSIAQIRLHNGKQLLGVYIYPQYTDEKRLYSSVSNIQNLLGVHEYIGHFIKNMDNSPKSHLQIYKDMRRHSSWEKTTSVYQKYMNRIYIQTINQLKQQTK